MVFISMREWQTGTSISARSAQRETSGTTATERLANAFLCMTVSEQRCHTEKLKPGQSIKTKDEKVAVRFSIGLRKALRDKGADAHYRVSQRMNMPDGYHRVFLLAKPVKMADLPGRKIVNLKG